MGQCNYASVFVIKKTLPGERVYGNKLMIWDIYVAICTDHPNKREKKYFNAFRAATHLVYVFTRHKGFIYYSIVLQSLFEGMQSISKTGADLNGLE